MAPLIHPPVEDSDLDDAELWEVIDKAAASHSSLSGSWKALAITQNTVPSPAPTPYQSPQFSKISGKHHTVDEDVRILSDGEVLQEPWAQERPQKKIARTGAYNYGQENRMVVVKQMQHTPHLQHTSPAATHFVSSPSPGRSAVQHLQHTPPLATQLFSSPSPGRFTVQEISPVSESSSYIVRQNDENDSMRHSLSGQFPSVALFKECQNAAMAILEKTDCTVICGNPYIKKTGWRKISMYFNVSYEIKDKTIEFDDNRNVVRAEFVVRAHMKNGRFSDGWGSCERREKRFMKPNHDIPSTAETRAKNKACQDLLGIGEYRYGAGNTSR